MKISIIFLPLVMLLTSSVWAQEIPKDSVRQEEPSRYIALPNFPGPIEFVREGVENDALMAKYLQPHTIDFIKSQHLHWLQVRDVYVDKKGISVSGEAIFVPLIASVRYQKRTDLIDGTLNGLFKIFPVTGGPAKIDLVAVDDNSAVQALGRLFWRVNYKQLVDDVAGDTLRMFFENDENIQNMLSISRR